MKKFLGVSLVAVLAVSPMVANAADPITPIVPVKVASNETVGVASTKYVKEAYNAMAGKVNAELAKKQDTITDLATIRSQAGAAANKDLGNLSATGTGVITTNVTTNAAKGTFSTSTTYSDGTIGAAIKAVNTTAGNAADKDLSNLSTTGKANVSAKGTYNASTNYDAGTVGAAIKGKQDTITDLATIRSGAAAGATALQESSIDTGTDNGKIKVGTKQVAVKGLGSAAYTESTVYATSAQGTKADDAATAIGTGTLSTTANTLIAAVNEVNSKKLTVYSGWNDGGDPTEDTTQISLN